MVLLEHMATRGPALLAPPTGCVTLLPRNLNQTFTLECVPGVPVCDSAKGHTDMPGNFLGSQILFGDGGTLGSEVRN